MPASSLFRCCKSAADISGALARGFATPSYTTTRDMTAGEMASAITTYARMTDFAEAEQRLEKIEEQLATRRQ